MKIGIEYRAIVARSHCIWVIGLLGQAYFRELVPFQNLNGWVMRLRMSWAQADKSEEGLERFKLDIATLEEELAEATAKSGGFGG